MKRNKTLSLIIFGIFVLLYSLLDFCSKQPNNSFFIFVLSLFFMFLFLSNIFWGTVNSISIIRSNDYTKSEKIIWSGISLLPALFLGYVVILDLFTKTISNGR